MNTSAFLQRFFGIFTNLKPLTTKTARRLTLWALVALISSATVAQAQGVGDDVYDPFADYAEFEFGGQQEADINFFRHGRFFTIGGLFGYRSFTQSLGQQLYDPSFHYGMFFNYFFDMRLALQFYFSHGNHDLGFISAASGTVITGNLAMLQMGLGGKFYINPQNLTRGLAQLNPYLGASFSQTTRTANVANQAQFGRDSATGVDVAFGIEVPLMRNKTFIGAQATYHLVTFPDANNEIRLPNNEGTGIFPRGDILTFNATLGVSF